MLSAPSVSSATTGTTKTGSEKKRRWAVCAAKVKAGALRAKTFVTSSDSESSNDSSESEHESEFGSDRGSDSGVRDCGSRPHPLKVRYRRPHAEQVNFTLWCTPVPLFSQETSRRRFFTRKVQLYTTFLCVEYRESKYVTV